MVLEVVAATDANSRLGLEIGTVPMEAAQIQIFLGGLSVIGALPPSLLMLAKMKIGKTQTLKILELR